MTIGWELDGVAKLSGNTRLVHTKAWRETPKSRPWKHAKSGPVRDEQEHLLLEFVRRSAAFPSSSK